MLDAGHRVTVACSGGADSTFLLVVLLSLSRRFGWVVSVAHLNHRLRGSESEADQRFVARLAKENDLEFFCSEADVRGVAAKHHANLEGTARKLRYEFFRSLIAGGKTDRVAVGHTADDQAETVLLRLIRGAGLRGLAAIRPVLAPGIIRPLINVKGLQLRRWLAARSINWREDSSNQETRFRRNLIRRNILPPLSEINPSIVDSLAKTARLCQLDESFWNSYVAHLMKRHSLVDEGTMRIELSALRQLPAAASHRLIEQAIATILKKDAGTSQYNQIKSILKWALSSAGQSLALPRNLAASKDSRHLIITSRNTVSCRKENARAEAGYSYQLEVPESIVDSRLGFRCRVEFVDLGSTSEAYNNAGYVLLNQSLLKFPLTLRSWKPGDAYCLHGRRKLRKLKELFQRQGVPREFRNNWPVLESNSRIVWARQFGVAEGFSPPSGAEKAVLFTYSSWNASNGKEPEPR